MRKGLIIGIFGLLSLLIAIGFYSYTNNYAKKKTVTTLPSFPSYQPNPAALRLLTAREPVAQIGQVKLTSQDLKDQLKFTLNSPLDYHSYSEDDLSLKIQKALDEMIEDEILAQEANRRGLQVASKTVLSRHELASKLLQEESSRQPQLTDAEEREFYKNHGEKFTLAPSNYIRELFIPFTSQDDLKRKTGPTYQKARSLAKRIHGGELLETLAQQFAPGNKEKVAGYEFRGAVMEANDAAAVLHLNPGMVAGPFRIEGGISIFQGISRLPQRFIPFYRAQPTIQGYLHEQRLLRIRKRLVEEANQHFLVRRFEPSNEKL